MTLSVSLNPDFHQFDDPLLLALSIAKQIMVMHNTMLPALTSSPLAQDKAAHLLGCSRRAVEERPVVRLAKAEA